MSDQSIPPATESRTNNKPLPALGGQGMLDAPRQVQDMRQMGSALLRVNRSVKKELVSGAAKNVVSVESSQTAQTAPVSPVSVPKTVAELVAAKKAGAPVAPQPATPVVDDGFRDACEAAGWDPGTMFDTPASPVQETQMDGVDVVKGVASGLSVYFKRNPKVV